MTSTLGEHNFASHYLLTGYKPTPALTYPGLPAIATHMRQDTGNIPPNIALQKPNAMSLNGYLDGATSPFVVTGDPSKPDFKIKDLKPRSEISSKRLMRRRSLRSAVDSFVQQREQNETGSEDPAFAQAYRLIGSPAARQAFDLSKEPASVRSREHR